MLNDSQCPTDTVHPIIGHACPPGHFCVGGTIYPQGCPAGTYQSLMERSECFTCPAGYYCVANTTTFDSFTCPSGYYCLLGTKHAFEFACPAGTFNNQTAMTNQTACQPCTAGMYCEGEANRFPTGECDPGWYCSNGSSSARVRTFKVKNHKPWSGHKELPGEFDVSMVVQWSSYPIGHVMSKSQGIFSQ